MSLIILGLGSGKEKGGGSVLCPSWGIVTLRVMLDHAVLHTENLWVRAKESKVKIVFKWMIS